MHSVFDDEGMEFDRRILLGWAYRQLTDAGEVLEALDGVTDGDGESWIARFSALGDRLRARAGGPGSISCWSSAGLPRAAPRRRH
jgi:hypothetical protein